ncbi:MAG: 23S rRNA (pseudouridine(1915)-N(3))-methyltransferase RlmH, partial [Oribacterium parvum]
MTLRVCAVGKIKEKFFKEALSEYGKRLFKYCKLEMIEVADEKTREGASS